MSREAILQIAKNELGIAESPSNSNKTKYGAWYGMDGQPWCAMFVSWVYDKAGSPLGRVESNKGYASCQGGYAFWKSKNQLTKTPQPGDIIVYDWNGDGHCDHTGIFESWINEGSTFKAYEGNTSISNDSNGGVVMLRTRKVASVKAFITPAILGAPLDNESFSEELKKGDKGARVVKLQRMLYDLGSTIIVDGDFGSQTEKAIKEVQAANNLPADGIANAAFAGFLESILLKKEAPVSKLTQGTFLKKGASGAVVLTLQKALNKSSGNNAVTEDGVFGNQTLEALKNFQQQNNLKPDGVAGPETFKALKIKDI